MGAELDGITFTRCRFDDAGLEELVTRRCVFEECVLTGVRMGGSGTSAPRSSPAASTVPGCSTRPGTAAS